MSLAQVIIISFLIPSQYHLIKQKAEIDLQKQDMMEKANLLQEEISHEESLKNALQKSIVNYAKLKDLSEQLSLSLTVADTSAVLLAAMDKLFEGKELTKIVYLLEPVTGELKMIASARANEKANVKTKKGDIFDDWLIKKGQPLLVEDAKKDFRFDIEKVSADDDRKILSLISVPLVIADKRIGVLRIDSPLEDSFSTGDLRFLRTIGDLAAVAIENAQLFERIEELAVKDSLTGLYLRRYLAERMTTELNRHLRNKRELAFLMIDLDEFKKYNDVYGHMAGDIVLKSIAETMQECFHEPGDLICRYGGEEFVVLLPDCSRKNAIALAEEFRKKVANKEIVLRQKKTRITVSIGVAMFPADAQIKDDLILKADNALYKAKSEGRNKVCCGG